MEIIQEQNHHQPTQSESIAEIAKAMCIVQQTALFAITDSENPFFKAKYADLSSIWSVIREPLTKNGLSVIQTTEPNENGITVITTLMHTSGEYISGKLFLRPDKPTIQGIGSAITYARRYALSAIMGVCPQDDDGENAMDRKKKVEPKKEMKKIPDKFLNK